MHIYRVFDQLDGLFYACRWCKKSVTLYPKAALYGAAIIICTVITHGADRLLQAMKACIYPAREGETKPMADTPAKPLMPHATASWLVDNSGLSFEQIAEFCGLHILEVQAMADDLASSKYTGRDPIQAGELTQEELDKGQADADYTLVISKGPEQKHRTKGPRYTPVSKRQDKPDGIAWLLRNHAEISDGQIGKLIGTTRNTINAIRDRSHWNIANIQPKDPVTLGLCSQRDLDAVVAKAAKRAGIDTGDNEDNRLGGDRAAMIEQLQNERAAERQAAEDALKKAEEEAMTAKLLGGAPIGGDSEN
jgi:hypothetical protein